MHKSNNTDYYNAIGSMFYDPSTTYDVVQEDIPAVPMVDRWDGLFNFNETFMDYLHTQYEACGYKDFTEEAMTFPPSGKLSTPPFADGNYTAQAEAGCALWVGPLRTRNYGHCH